MERYSEYKDSGVKWLGEIPSHWEVAPFGSHFSFRKGLPITKANLIESGVAVISYGQIHAKENLGTTLSESLVRYVSKDYLGLFSWLIDRAFHLRANLDGKGRRSKAKTDKNKALLLKSLYAINPSNLLKIFEKST